MTKQAFSIINLLLSIFISLLMTYMGLHVWVYLSLLPFALYFFYLWQNKRDLSQNDIDFIYYYGFILTIVSIAATAIIFGTQAADKLDKTGILIQFSAGLVATGLGLIFRIILNASTADAKDIAVNYQEILTNLNQQIGSLVQTQNSTSNSLYKLHEKSINEINQAVLQSIENNDNKINGLLQKFEQQLQSFDLNESAKILEIGFIEFNEKMIQTANQFSVKLNAIDFIKSMKSIENSAESLEEKFRNLKITINTDLIHDSLKKLTESLDAMSEDLNNDSKKSFKRFNDSFSKLSNTSENTANAMDRIQQNLSQNRISEMLIVLNNNFSSLSENLNKLETMLNQLKDSEQKDIKSINQTIDKFTLQTNELIEIIAKNVAVLPNLNQAILLLNQKLDNGVEKPVISSLNNNQTGLNNRQVKANNLPDWDNIARQNNAPNNNNYQRPLDLVQPTPNPPVKVYEPEQLLPSKGETNPDYALNSRNSNPATTANQPSANIYGREQILRDTNDENKPINLPPRQFSKPQSGNILVNQDDNSYVPFFSKFKNFFSRKDK